MQRAWDIDDLPNPHLATTLAEDFTGMNAKRATIITEYPMAYGCEFEKLNRKEKVIMFPLRLAHLRACNLPDHYDQLAEADQKIERHKVWHDWYDEREPGELCSNVDRLVAALYLWVEHVEKASEYTRGVYFRRDAKTKYEIVRLAMSPPRIESEPAKTCISMPRYTTKTNTIIRQLCKMMVICRPRTDILMSQFGEDRTEEEMTFIRDDVEHNEVIHAEFGGKGVIFPKSARTGKTWSSSHLDFINNPGCRILGFSYGSAQRGRHPTFCVLDDVEDEKNIADQEYRRKFFGNLFGRYMGMMGRGSKIVWMGTTILNSCLAMALRGMVEKSDGQDEISEILDTRFNSWNKFRIGMIREREDGTRESIMPDHVSVAGYDAKVEALGIAMASAELDGLPTGYGQTALIRDERQHGYMHAQSDGGEEYFIDLHSGEQMPWPKFLEELECAGALDPADSTASDADFGSTSICGVNPAGKFFVLDQLNQKMIADEWPGVAIGMCMEWDAAVLAVEKTAMQTFIFRIAQRVRRELEENGQTPPRVVPIDNAGKRKKLRILGTLRPLFRRHMIAFPQLAPVTISGTVHNPARHPNMRHLQELKKQIDMYTDEGKGSDHDDAADSLEMAIRTLNNRRGQRIVVETTAEKNWKRWDRIGASFSPGAVPEEFWTPDMKRQVEGEMPFSPTEEKIVAKYDIYD